MPGKVSGGKNKRKNKMKKILIAALAVTVSAIANAAAINWSVTGVQAPGTTTATSGYVAYLFDEATVASSSIATAVSGGTFDSLVASAIATGTSGSTGTIIKSGIGSYGASASTADPEVHKFYTVLFDAGTVAAASNYILTGDTTVTFTSATGTKSAAFVNISSSNTWAPTSAVPEPTSGLLLLLGMAGLALKRKVA